MTPTPMSANTSAADTTQSTEQAASILVFRLVSEEEKARVDSDQHLPFGSFAPGTWQRTLIGLANNSFLRRGTFRYTMRKLVMGTAGRPLDVVFRGCCFRLRDIHNAAESGFLLNPDYNIRDIEFLLEGMPQGGVFVDIGANVGMFALPLAKKAGPAGRVVAIEANPLTANRLRWNANASSLDNVSIVACAMSDREGTGSLRIRNDDIATVMLDVDTLGSTPVRTLPSVLSEQGVQKIDALKIDIEGHEDRVLAPFLESCESSLLPARIVLERAPGTQDFPACARALERRGYRRVARTRNNSLFILR